MEYLNRIHDKYYSYYSDNLGAYFYLSGSECGVYSRGFAWFLNLVIGGQKIHIAKFVTRSDGHNCESDSYLGTMWTDRQAIMRHANNMVSRIINGGSV